jgi:hypothetical protein
LYDIFEFVVYNLPFTPRPYRNRGHSLQYPGSKPDAQTHQPRTNVKKQVACVKASGYAKKEVERYVCR